MNVDTNHDKKRTDVLFRKYSKKSSRLTLCLLFPLLLAHCCFVDTVGDTADSGAFVPCVGVREMRGGGRLTSLW